jgi:hypothetical protein
MGKILDFPSKGQPAPVAEVPVLTPAGITTEGVIAPDGSGVLKVTLWENETTPVAVIFITEELAANAGVLLANSAAALTKASAEYRHKNARGLSNRAKQAQSPIILPPGITDGLPSV